MDNAEERPVDLINLGSNIDSIDLDRNEDETLEPAIEAFVERIHQMNKTFKLDCNYTPTDLGEDRLEKFYNVLSDELTELEDVYVKATPEDREADMTILADTLGDLVVYIFSEAQRWGIPLLEVLHIIMDSQNSKLVDGLPVMAEDGSKFIKGPNFKPPEDRIKTLLESMTVKIEDF